MAVYKENFSVGSRVRIANRSRLEEFIKSWKYHHKLEPRQLEYADKIFEVEKIGFYHGGDVLYELRGVLGLWHEELLSAV